MTVERNRKTITLFSTCINEKLCSEECTLKEKAYTFVNTLEEAFAEYPKDGMSISEIKRCKELMIVDFATVWFKRIVKETADASFKEYYVKTKEVVNVLFATCAIEQNVNLTRIFNKFIQKSQYFYKWSFAIFSDIAIIHNLFEGSSTQYGQIDSVIDKNFIMFLNNSHEYDLPLLLYSIGEPVRRKFWKDKLVSFIKKGDFSDIVNPYFILEINVVDACPELAKDVLEGILKTTLNCKGTYYPIQKILKEMAEYDKEHTVEFNVRERMCDIIFCTVMRGNGKELNSIMELLINSFNCDEECDDYPKATEYLRDVTLRFASTIFACFEREKLYSLAQNEIFRETVKSQKGLRELLNL